MFALLTLLNIPAAALLVGTLMEVAIADIPLVLELSRETFVIVHRGIDRRKHPYMPICNAITALTALGELFFYRSFWQILCIIVGIAGFMSIVVISELINMPLNRKINVWSPSSIGEDVFVMRDKWIHAHYVRTTAGAFGFVALLLPLFICSETMNSRTKTTN